MVLRLSTKFQVSALGPTLPRMQSIWRCTLTQQTDLPSSPPMTFVLSLLNEDVAIQLSDRRLTSQGHLVTDEANKTVFLNALDCRLVMGFSGLARAGSIDVEDRILQALTDLAPPDFQWAPMRERFTGAMDTLFQEDPLRGATSEQRATSMHFVGFMRSDPPLPVSTFISNHNDPVNKLFANPTADKFRETTVFRKPDDRSNILIQALGAYSHIGTEDMAPLRRMMIERRPPEAIVNKGVELIRAWADRPGARGVIGKQITSVVLPSDFSQWASGRSHSNVVQDTSFFLSEVTALPWATLATRGGGLTAVHSAAGAWPKVGRNRPCPCSSGKKYKYCHGQPSMPTRQMIIELQVNASQDR